VIVPDGVDATLVEGLKSATDATATHATARRRECPTCMVSCLSSCHRSDKKVPHPRRAGQNHVTG